MPGTRLNIETKARCQDPGRVRAILKRRRAKFVGTDKQTDTYFIVPKGRLKLREGTIENALIYYERKNSEGPKRSDFILAPVKKGPNLKKLLTGSLGVLAVVKKTREIYFIGNIKFHIDRVAGLGSFLEIEAMRTRRQSGRDLLGQCRSYLKLFKVGDKDLVSGSYSDLLMEKASEVTGAKACRTPGSSGRPLCPARRGGRSRRPGASSRARSPRGSRCRS